jgi:cytochrome P450
MARAFRSVRADPLTFLGRVQREYGDLVAFPVPGPPVLLLNDPDDIRHVLQTNARHWGKRTVQYAALARVTGPGLLASAEPSWIGHRRTAAPAFHHQRLEAVGDQVRAAVDHAVRSWERSRGPVETPVDLAPLTMYVALDAVGRALFSADLTGRSRLLLDASADAAELVVRVGRAVVPLPAWTPTPTNLRLAWTRGRLDAASAEIVADRRASGGADGASGDDLLGLLLDSGLSDGEVRDELVTMIIAGHETVAAALAWTLMLLAEHPSAQDRVRAELETHQGSVPLLGQRERLPWTRAVVDEALRLFPPAWAISRRSESADVIGGREVPAGTMAIISPWLVHRHEQWWPDPLAFRPERFLATADRVPAYLPFGSGPRLCIGREFALGEMVLVLSRLLTAYRVDVPPHWTRPRPDTRVAVHPHGGMPLLVTPVDGSPS